MSHGASFFPLFQAFVMQFLEKPPADPDRRVEVFRNFMEVSEEKVRSHPLWANAADEEMEEMTESLERFVLSKIYRVVFAPSPSDLERDKQLKTRISDLSWIEPRHLDIKLDMSLPKVQRMLAVAVEQLRNWNTFKAPRDKMVCILNACKAVWKLVQSNTSGQAAGADDFLPHLIFTVIRANPPNLHSNVQYIDRYRHPEKMAQEFGYYYTQLASVVPFLETCTHRSFTGVSEAQFSRNVSLTRAGKEVPLSDSEMSQSSAAKVSQPVPPIMRSQSSPLIELPPSPQPQVLGSNPTSFSGLGSGTSPSVAAAAPPPPLLSPSSFMLSPTPALATQVVVPVLSGAASAPVPSILPAIPKEVFRFVGRNPNSLTVGEISELMAAYEVLAKAAASNK